MRDTKSKLLLKLNQSDTRERCGFVTKSGRVIEVSNIAENPEKSFHMDPVAVLRHFKNNNIVATWHTHPQSDPNLSGDDYECFRRYDDLVHYIVGRRDGQVTVTSYVVENDVVVQR